MISLTDLKSKRAAMTQGELHQGELDRGSAFDADGHGVLMCKRDLDATGIVATHNAADVLIEIAQAALAWQMSPQIKSREARKRLLAALAKIKP